MIWVSFQTEYDDVCRTEYRSETKTEYDNKCEVKYDSKCETKYETVYEEVCEEVEYDECRELEVQVPIKICKSVDPNREPIINREIAGTETRQPGRQRELRN